MAGHRTLSTKDGQTVDQLQRGATDGEYRARPEITLAMAEIGSFARVSTPLCRHPAASLGMSGEGAILLPLPKVEREQHLGHPGEHRADHRELDDLAIRKRCLKASQQLVIHRPIRGCIRQQGREVQRSLLTV